MAKKENAPAEEALEAEVNVTEPADEPAAKGGQDGDASDTEGMTEDAPAEIDPAEEKRSKAKWYVVHTYSGYENKVKANIEKTIENQSLQEEILEVRVPVIDTFEIKNGARKNVQRKMFPGYVLVHMLMNDDTWFVVRNTRGVTGFVGPGSKPVPLSDAEVNQLGIKGKAITVDFEVGDMISVVAGIWRDTTGVVQKIDVGKQTATINVELFGRETPVEISFAEVRKAN